VLLVSKLSSLHVIGIRFFEISSLFIYSWTSCFEVGAHVICETEKNPDYFALGFDIFSEILLFLGCRARFSLLVAEYTSKNIGLLSCFSKFGCDDAR
jgi:hypothetical protein